MGRFQEVYRLPNKQYYENGPLVIEAGVLQKDTADGKVLAQIKIQNLSNSIVVACKVSIDAFEINGRNKLCSIEHTYLDLCAHRGECFGSKNPIYLPNDTRMFKVEINEVVFASGEIWDTQSIPLDIPKQTNLNILIQDKNLLEQYSIEVCTNPLFIPLEWADLFLSTCGTINKKDSICIYCGNTYENEKKYLDINLLREKYNERIKKINAENELIEEQFIHRKRLMRRRITLTLALSMFIIVSTILFIGLVVKPYRDKKSKYDTAQELLNEGKYLDAYSTFGELKNFEDSSQKAQTALEKYNDIYDKLYYPDIVKIIECKNDAEIKEIFDEPYDTEIIKGGLSIYYYTSKKFGGSNKYRVILSYSTKTGDFMKCGIWLKDENVGSKIKNDLKTIYGDEYTVGEYDSYIWYPDNWREISLHSFNDSSHDSSVSIDLLPKP